MFAKRWVLGVAVAVGLTACSGGVASPPRAEGPASPTPPLQTCYPDLEACPGGIYGSPVPSGTGTNTPAADSPSGRPKKTTHATFASVDCPSDSLRGVYHSYRLHVLKACQWYVGTVERVIHEDDGDYHVDVAPASGYKGFLDSDNYSAQHGQLVIEVMPGQALPIPSVGERISVFGTWVYDADHGWNEIHPVWAITYSSGKTVDSLPPRTPQHDPDAGSGGGGSGGGSGGSGSSGCDPDYVVTGGPCLKAGIGDYDCYGGGGDGPNYTPSGATIKVVGTDVFRLDSDHDGLACE